MKALFLLISLFVSVGASCQTTDMVYDLVEQMPIFPGGEDSMRHYLLYNLQYPEYAKNHHIEGRIDVRFLVDEHGNLSNVVVQKGEIQDLNKEAVRVVKSFPPFTPGVHEGKPVKVIVILPIIFQLDDSNLKKKKKG